MQRFFVFAHMWI